jgi:hypothetical protein
MRIIPAFPQNQVIQLSHAILAVWIAQCHLPFHGFKRHTSLLASLFCRLSIPLRSFGIILGHAQTFFVHHAKPILGNRKSLFCRLAKPYRRFGIPSHVRASSFSKQRRKNVLNSRVYIRAPRFCVFLPRYLFIPPYCLGIILGYAPAFSIHHPKIYLGNRMSLLRRFLIPLHGFCFIPRYAPPHDIHPAKAKLRFRVALIRGSRVPFCGFGIILLNAPPLVVHHAKVELRSRVSLLCRAPDGFIRTPGKHPSQNQTNNPPAFASAYHPKHFHPPDCLEQTDILPAFPHCVTPTQKFVPISVPCDIHTFMSDGNVNILLHPEKEEIHAPL